MTLSVYNPCKDGIPAKIWELLRRNESFREKTDQLINLQNSLEKFNFIKKDSNYFAKVAWHWMFKPIVVKPKRGQPKAPGPRITEKQDLDRYKKDKADKRAPLQYKFSWPTTPQGFQEMFCAAWDDSTEEIHEIISSQGLASNNELPGILKAPGIPLDPAPSDLYINKCIEAAVFLDLTLKYYRVFAVPRAYLRGKDSHNNIIKFINDKIAEESPSPKVQLFGTKAQWRSFLAVEYEKKHKSKNLSIGTAIDKAIDRLRLGKNLSPETRRNRYHSRIEGQVQAIDYFNKNCPDQKWLDPTRLSKYLFYHQNI